MSAPTRVVLTRPEREALPWQQALQAHGFEVLALPLIAIAPVSGQSPLAGPGTCRALMFVSGNAVTHFFASKHTPAQSSIALVAMNIRAWATGPGTVRALLEAGVPPHLIDSPPESAGQFDSEALWAQVKNQVQPGDRVVIVRGADAGAPALAGGVPGAGRDWLAQQLTQAGASVDFLVTYQRALPRWSELQCAQARRAATDGSVWLLSSSEAVGNLQALVPGQGWAQARAVATHARIAHAATQAGFGVVCESRPLLSALIASIESLA